MNVLVTGGSRGIGFAIAEELAKAGHELALVGRDPDNLATASQSLGASVKLVVQADLSQVEGPKNVKAAATGCGFKPSVLILSAGTYHEELLLDASAAHINEQFQVNILSQIALVQEFKDDLRATGGRVIIIGSTAAFEPYAYGAVYGITKWAVRGFAENLRAELRADKVGVTLLHPGATWTDLWAGVELPRERLLEPSDIAIMVASMLRLSPQAVVDEMIIRPVEGDMHD